MKEQITEGRDSFDRLKVLYGVSKLLSSLESVELTFPKIFSLCASRFPLTTAVLIEKRQQRIVTSLWHSQNASQAHIAGAIGNAKDSFIYFTGTPAAEVRALSFDSSPARERSERTHFGSYITLPLIVDNLPPFGIIQVEGAGSLSEKDLEFVDSLSDLIAIAVDRDHKTQYATERRAAEDKENSSKLSRSEANVTNLELERGLRESFVTLLTHDLRTPLAAVKMAAQLIQLQAESSGEVFNFARRIVNNVHRADQMISDLLDANRIHSGEKLPLDLESFDFQALVEETLDELTRVHGKRFVLQSKGPVQGFWDRRGLRRILENLCNNAVKYGSANGVITVSIQRDSEYAVIAVKNSGEPIPLEDQHSLFQQFHRSRNAQVSLKKGWGIGLTLVRGVAEAHNGSVDFESSPEMGTVFTVRIPLDCRKIVEKHDLR